MGITQTQGVQWARNSIGKAYDYDGAFGVQCFDLINQYAHDLFGVSFSGAVAKDLMRTGNVGGFRVIPNSSTFYPLPGDIFVYNNGSAGHTGIVLESVSTSGFVGVDQNGGYNNEPSTRRTFNYRGFAGVVRPPFTAEIKPPVLPSKNSKQAISKGINYETHVSKVGWMNNVSNGALSGSTGFNLPVEATKIIYNEGNGSVEYRVHASGIGWMPWVKSGQVAGTTGQSRAIEAIQAKLTGDAANYYHLEYQAHVAKKGWLGLVRNGAVAGTTGQKLILQALKMKLVRKPIEQGKNKPETKGLSYRIHLAKEGWLGYVKSNQMAGTTGLNIDSQCLEIYVDGKKDNVDIEAHVAKKGWIANSGGTVGQGLSLQAIKIKLKNGLENEYDISYQVHVAKKGWMSWVKNGAMAGTTGQNLAIQAIRIKLISK